MNWKNQLCYTLRLQSKCRYDLKFKSENWFWYSTQNDSSGQSFVWNLNKPFKTKIHNKQLEVYSKLFPFLSHLPIFLIFKGLSFLFWAFWQLLKWLVGQGWIPFKYNYSSAKFDFLFHLVTHSQSIWRINNT